MLESIKDLKNGDSCYPLGRADVSVTKTDSDKYPFHLLDGHGYNYWFDTAEHCAMWIEGDRAGIEEGIHFI